MPKYKVLRRGFFNDRLYDPEGKRKVLHTEHSFPNKPKSKKEDLPAWLERIEDETIAQARTRKASEKNKAKAAKNKHEEDQKDIAGATFMSNEASKSSAVETL